MHSELSKDFEILIFQLAKDDDIEIIEWVSKIHRQTTRIQIIADKYEGGISLDQCTALNKKIVRAVEERNWLNDDFTVEVSSPGIDRDLRTARDFTRILGRNVRVHCKELVDGKLEHHGTVKNVNDDYVMIDRNGKEISIPLHKITKAVQVIQFE